MDIGFRPTHRTAGGRSKGSVRAISWVFAWGQSRHTIPAWFGIGVALAAWRNENPVRLAKLQVMYREWPFFRTLLSNAQMAQAKTDLGTAGEYAELCEDEAEAKQVLELIHTEFRRARSEILAAADSRSLLQENPALAISLASRSEYLDPLNSVQVALLRWLGELPAEEQTR